MARATRPCLPPLALLEWSPIDYVGTFLRTPVNETLKLRQPVPPRAGPRLLDYSLLRDVALMFT
eukprot:2387282-Prymnesium_polylepis.1